MSSEHRAARAGPSRIVRISHPGGGELALHDLELHFDDGMRMRLNHAFLVAKLRVQCTVESGKV